MFFNPAVWALIKSQKSLNYNGILNIVCHATMVDPPYFNIQLLSKTELQYLIN